MCNTIVFNTVHQYQYRNDVPLFKEFVLIRLFTVESWLFNRFTAAPLCYSGHWNKLADLGAYFH